MLNVSTPRSLQLTPFEDDASALAWIKANASDDVTVLIRGRPIRIVEFWPSTAPWARDGWESASVGICAEIPRSLRWLHGKRRRTA